MYLKPASLTDTNLNTSVPGSGVSEEGEGEEGVGGGVSSSGSGTGEEGAVSSSGANGQPPIPPTDAAHALATLASAALHHNQEQVCGSKH